MAAKITREQFLARVGDLARASGKHSADWALTIAAMLAATKVCPSPQGSDPGFLDQSHELTKGEWLSMLSIMSARSTTEARGKENPFYLAGEKMPEAPGILEHLRRLVLASQCDVNSGPRVHHPLLVASQRAGLGVVSALCRWRP